MEEKTGEKKATEQPKNIREAASQTKQHRESKGRTSKARNPCNKRARTRTGKEAKEGHYNKREQSQQQGKKGGREDTQAPTHFLKGSAQCVAKASKYVKIPKLPQS